MGSCSFQSMFIYSKEIKYPIAVVFFYGDDVYIRGTHKVRVGLTEPFEKSVFDIQDGNYVDLFLVLKEIVNVGEFRSISSVKEELDEVCDLFQSGSPLPYTYKYDKISKQIFNNILKHNKMKDIMECLA